MEDKLVIYLSDVKKDLKKEVTIKNILPKYPKHNPTREKIDWKQEKEEWEQKMDCVLISIMADEIARKGIKDNFEDPGVIEILPGSSKKIVHNALKIFDNERKAYDRHEKALSNSTYTYKVKNSNFDGINEVYHIYDSEKISIHVPSTNPTKNIELGSEKPENWKNIWNLSAVLLDTSTFELVVKKRADWSRQT